MSKRECSCDQDPITAATMSCECCGADVGQPCRHGAPDDARSILRDALGKQGPRAHTLDCDASARCWMCRARALLGIEEGR